MRESEGARSAPSRRRNKGLQTRQTRWRRLVSRWLPDHIPIAYKLAMAITLLVVASMALLGLTIISNQTQLMREQMNDFGQTVVNQLAESAIEPVLANDLLGLRVTTNNLAASDSVLGAAVYSDSGEVLASSGVLPAGVIVQLYERSRPLEDSTHTFDWRRRGASGAQSQLVSFVCPIRFQDLTAGHALVTFTRASMVESSQAATTAIVWTTVLIGVLTTITAFVMSRRLSRPIQDLMAARRAIDEGDFGYRFVEGRKDEIGYLMEGFNSMAEGLLEKSQVENVLSRFVDNSVASELLENLDKIRLGGKHVTASVLFADIVGFTSRSEKLEPEEIAELLNEYFDYVWKSSRLFHGRIDKFIGDCVMVVFGVPQKDPEHRFHAIACAFMIQRLVERLNVIGVDDGRLPVEFRIAVNCGDMLAGNLGTHDRMEYTVVGDAVNLASRLSSISESGQIVVSEAMAGDPMVRDRVVMRRYKEARLRGKKVPVSTFLVEDIVPEYRQAIEREIDAMLAEKELG